VSSFQEKLTTMEAENQLLRQQALLRMPVRTIPENRSPKSVCGLFTPDLSVPSLLVQICDHFRFSVLCKCWLAGAFGCDLCIATSTHFAC
jgi:hypothetical protein